MELEQFIHKTLVSIFNGVKDANKEINASQTYFVVEPAAYHKDRGDGYIQFDVAVTVTNANESKGSAGIQVWSIGVGGSKGASVSDQTVTRIKFGIAPNTTIQ